MVEDAFFTPLLILTDVMAVSYVRGSQSCLLVSKRFIAHFTIELSKYQVADVVQVVLVYLLSLLLAQLGAPHFVESLWHNVLDSDKWIVKIYGNFSLMFLHFT